MTKKLSTATAEGSKTLPPEWVAEDKRLQEAEKASGEALAKLRWEGTLDPDGPGLSFAAYGRQVGVGSDVIHTYAHTHADSDNLGAHQDLSFTERMRLNRMSADRRMAYQAIAKVEGKSVNSTLERDKFHQATAALIVDDADCDTPAKAEKVAALRKQERLDAVAADKTRRAEEARLRKEAADKARREAEAKAEAEARKAKAAADKAQQAAVAKAQAEAEKDKQAAVKKAAQDARREVLTDISKADKASKDRKKADDPVVGFGLAVYELMSVGGMVRSVGEELSKPWTLTAEDRVNLDKAWEMFTSDVDGLTMAVEALRGGGIAAGAEALLKEGV